MTNQHHTIKAILRRNPMKNANGSYLAQTCNHPALSIEDICNSLCSKHGTGVDPDALAYHVRLFLEEMGELLAEGHAVNTGYFAAGATIRGSFSGQGDTFDPERHKVVFKFSQGNVLRKMAAQSNAEVLRVSPVQFGVSKVTDTATGSENDRLTPGKILKITGQKLKLVGSHPDVGIYFTDSTTAERFRVDSTEIVTNQNGSLMIVIPDLPICTYYLAVCTQYAGKGTPLASPRTSTFAPLLRVE